MNSSKNPQGCAATWRQTGSALALLSIGLLGILPLNASAHPLGQNTFNRQAIISVGPHAVHLHYLLDLAEIPTVAAAEEADTNHDGDVSDAEWQDYAERWRQSLPAGLVLSIAGRPLDLQAGAVEWAVKPGTSGFSTLRMQVELDAPAELGTGNASLEYRDQTRADRLGWKEVDVRAEPGVHLASSDAGTEDRSARLTNFTLRNGNPPPDELAAHASVSVGAPGASDSPAGQPDSATRWALGTDRSAHASAAPTRWSLAWSFYRLGMHHIATGWDHLMFLLGLVMLSGSLRRLAKTITAFTLAHSITLALAAEGLVHPPGAWVEALIALTIAYVGVVALLWRERRHGAWLAFGFGLVHGFGFAGALAESLGNAQSLRLVALVTFNLGIESFQLMLVCLVVPVLRMLQNHRGYGYVRMALASSVFLAGSGWLLARTLGEGPLSIAGMVVVSGVLAAILWHLRPRLEQPALA